jgi:transposase
MTSMQEAPRRRRVVVGVDTHKHIHVAVVVDELGGRIDTRSFAADRSGYEQLIDWASSLGREVIFGVEGTGSYGAGLASAIRRRSIGVLEVVRTDRRDRRLRGKSDTLDAENAARAVLNGQASAVPKSADGTAEMIRLVKVAKDVAVKARTSAMISLKAVLVNAPAELRGAAGAADEDGVDPAVRRAATRPARRPDVRRETHPASDREKVASPGRRDQDPRTGADQTDHRAGS